MLENYWTTCAPAQGPFHKRFWKNEGEAEFAVDEQFEESVLGKKGLDVLYKVAERPTFLEWIQGW